MKKVSVSLALFLSLFLSSYILAEETFFSFEEIPFSLIGASLSQENLVESIFNGAGNYTFFTKQEKTVGQKQGVSVKNIEYRDTPTLWMKVLCGDENVDVDVFGENGKYKTTYYGAVVGLDFDRKYTDNFDATYGFFISYTNYELKINEIEDVKLKQNGGFAGIRGNLYFGRLFFSCMVDYGLSFNKIKRANDSYDHNSKNFNSSTIGVAGKIGYNFEVAEKSFTIQPNVILTGTYMFIIDNLKNESKVDNIKNYTLEPGLKFIKTLGRCWILIGEGRYIVEKFEKKIEDDICYGNYTNLGLGIEKIWGYTVLNVKVNKTLCARDGYIVNAGIELKF